MPTIRLWESELGQVAGYRYRWDGRGYILMEYGPGYINHIRIDITLHPNGRTYLPNAGGDRQYLVHEFHVKISNGHGAFLYMGFDYRGGGVWRPCWGHRQVGSQRYDLTGGEAAICEDDAREFLRALREVTTDMDQMLSIDAPPEMLRHAAL